MASIDLRSNLRARVKGILDDARGVASTDGIRREATTVLLNLGATSDVYLPRVEKMVTRLERALDERRGGSRSKKAA
jgi:hypothetical protein